VTRIAGPSNSGARQVSKDHAASGRAAWSQSSSQPSPRLTLTPPTRFETLVLPHLDAAYSLARYLMRGADDARDATQEAMLKALKHVDQLRGDDARPWLLAIVRNTCRTMLGRRGGGDNEISFDEAVHGTDEAGHPESELIRKADQEAVHRALEQLPVAYREVLVLRELQDLSYKEIAEIAQVPIGTVMSRLARGRERLEQLLRVPGTGGGGR